MAEGQTVAVQDFSKNGKIASFRKGKEGLTPEGLC